MAHNDPQSRNEAILTSILDGTEYTEEARSRIEALLIELKEVIENGGSGHEYSETEQEVGTWIDGSTIYEQTIVFANDIQITNDAWTTLSDYASLAQIVDKVIEAKGYFSSPIGWVTQPILMQKVGENLQVQSARVYSPSNLSIVIIQYTKIPEA